MEALQNAFAMSEHLETNTPRTRRRKKVFFEGTDCPTGKVAYRSAADVITALKGMKRKHLSSVDWYKCPECGLYHTSAKPVKK